MGGGDREEHAGSDRMPQPSKPGSTATDEALPGCRSLNLVSFELQNNETAQNPDSDAIDKDLIDYCNLNLVSFDLQNNETAQNSDSDATHVALLGNRSLLSVTSSELNPNLNGNEALQTDNDGQHWSELCCTMRPNATLFAAEYRAKLINRQRQSDDSSSFSDSDDPLDLTDDSLDSLSMMNQIGTTEMLEKFNDLNLEEGTKSVPEDRNDEILLSLVNEMKDLERLLVERKKWAYEKVLQASGKLYSHLTKLRKLRIENEENKRIRQGKQTAAEDPTVKRLSEMQTAWMKAIEQKERADLAVRYLEEDNATHRADIEASKLSASESMELCLRAMVREKTHLKKLASWQKQRAKLQEGIAVENQKLLELQEEMLQVEAAKKTAEAKWWEEQKTKECALAQVEEERHLREAIKVNKKRNDETFKLAIQCYKDDLQRLEQELSHIKTSTYRNQHSSNPSASGSQDETLVRLLHESDDIDEKEDGTDRECILCSEDEVSALFLPCAHQVLCASCNDKFGMKGMAKCPTCRVRIEQRIRVFSMSS